MAKAFSYDDCRVILILYRPTTNDNPSVTMTEPTLAKTYDPKSIEANWYETWLDSGHFACAPESSAIPYTIMMPPPNVTGSLHMGHALTFTLQDLLIRYQRMAGRDVLWQPGTDHAGIATQMVVERQLAEKNINRRDLGRDGFIEKIWEWKAESGGDRKSVV